MNYTSIVLKGHGDEFGGWLRKAKRARESLGGNKTHFSWPH